MGSLYWKAKNYTLMAVLVKSWDEACAWLMLAEDRVSDMLDGRNHQEATLLTIDGAFEEEK